MFDACRKAGRRARGRPQPPLLAVDAGAARDHRPAANSERSFMSRATTATRTRMRSLGGLAAVARGIAGRRPDRRGAACARRLHEPGRTRAPGLRAPVSRARPVRRRSTPPCSRFDFDSGVSGTLATVRATPFYWRVHVFGTKGSAEVLDEATHGRAQVRPARRIRSNIQPIDTLAAELDAFADAIESQAPVSRCRKQDVLADAVGLRGRAASRCSRDNR